MRKTDLYQPQVYDSYQMCVLDEAIHKIYKGVFKSRLVDRKLTSTHKVFLTAYLLKYHRISLISAIPMSNGRSWCVTRKLLVNQVKIFVMHLKKEML